MTTETKLRGGLALTLLSFIILGFYFNKQYEELEKCKIGNSLIQGGDIEKSQITNERDSLRDENFNLKVEIGRHELTRDEIFRKHKGLEIEYNKYYEHETE
jgi:hypothetical protein